MPLSPIQMFQNNGQNSIEGLLRAGPEAISNIMNQAISIGRSMSDKQLAQERDLFALRDRETQMNERRAEGAQQTMADTLRFGRAVYESDRKFAAATDQQNFERGRLSANDAFSQNIDERQMDLSESKFDYEKSLAEEERQRRIKAEEMFNRQYGGGGPTETPGTFTEQSAMSDEQDWAARGAKPVQATAESTYSDGNVDTTTQVPKASQVFAPPVTEQDPRRELAQLQEDLKNPALTGEARINAKMRADELERGGSGDTPAGQRAARSLEMREEDRAKKQSLEEASRIISPGSKAFVPPSVWGTKKYGNDTDKWPVELRAEATGYKNDPVAAELAYASKQSDIEKFASPSDMKLSDVEKEERRKIWRIAHGQGGGKSGGNSDLDWMMR